jgi:iron complex transport system substrate-binding protein
VALARAILLLSLAFATQSQSPSRPVRIVSTTLVTDEIAAGLVDASRIVAMSKYAADDATSNVATVAARIGRSVDRDIEQIVGLNPDVVLSTRYSKLDAKELLRKSSIPYHELTRFETVADIDANIRSIAKALGEVEKGESLLREMHHRLDQTVKLLPADRRSWRALYLAPGEWTAGRRTTFDVIIRSAGLQNAAASAGLTGNIRIGIEQIIGIDPDLIIVGTGYARDAAYLQQLSGDSRFATLKSVRTRRIVTIPSKYILTTSQFIGDAALELGRRVQGLP